MSLDRLGVLRLELADFPGARVLLERALAIRMRVCGPDHPGTAASLNNLGFLYYRLGQFAEARALCEQALALREKACGPEHSDTAESLDNLGLVLQPMEILTALGGCMNGPYVFARRRSARITSIRRRR